jgi:membrane peptidoglycan carboxypeptidase
MIERDDLIRVWKVTQMTPGVTRLRAGEDWPKMTVWLDLKRRPLADRGAKRRRWWRPVLFASILGLCLLIAGETQSSWLQSKVFSRWNESMTFSLADGPSQTIHFPEHGPFDQRRGYIRLPAFLGSLQARGYSVERQARESPMLRTFQQLGGFPPYPEKAAAGLTLVADDGRPYYAALHPQGTYGSFAAIPKVVTNSLLFIEDRELLDLDHPERNPAVNWDRLSLAVFKLGAGHAGGGGRPGGSTLATQIEKSRHSPGGRTTAPGEKLHQMVSASLRAYRNGPDTIAVREQIVVDALNSMPLAAVPGHGEVIGLGDGLQLWYGADLDRINRLLAEPAASQGDLAQRGLALKQVLSLIVAQRRPSYYLHQGRRDLEALTDSYLRLLAASGVIDARLRDAAVRSRLQFPAIAPETTGSPANMTKAVSAMRVELLSLLGTPSLYDLDRLDLTAQTTLDAQAQARITEVLHSLGEPDNLEALGLVGPRLLENAPPTKVAYSFTLFERGNGANLLRVQTDSVDQPLDLNVGTKMELGSTAKVRTLITYLDIIADLYDSDRSLAPATLEAMQETSDPLSRWVAQYLLKNGDQGLPNLLQAAMERTYSSSPYERFFTAGGSHTFENFDHKFSSGQLPVVKALEQSVNLVFIRVMRDIVDYHIAHIPDTDGLIANSDQPMRKIYLKQFADQEGRQYLGRFYKQYKTLDRPAILAQVADRAKYSRPRLAASFRTVLPDADYPQFAGLIGRWADPKVPDDDAMHKLYAMYAPDRLSLADRSYIARIHPLELWLAGFLYAHPDASWKDIVKASADVRQESYSWLFKSNRVAAQNKRIRILLEEEAFTKIHKQWQRLGYPFDHLVPSYATAIGTSGDRPDALAELMGIIVNNGIRLPTERIQQLHFAAGTPYDTVVKASPAAGKRVLRPEIASVVRAALINVVENGTARRASGALHAADGSPLAIGAKTGTGDNRTQQFGAGRRLIGSVVRSRTATLIFFIDDRFFGTITAHVDGPQAAQYKFTSALPAQLFKSLAPELEPLVQRPRAASPATAGLVAAG